MLFECTNRLGKFYKTPSKVLSDEIDFLDPQEIGEYQ